MTKISFDLVSPEKLIFNDEVSMIIIPGKDGDLGILPGHSKLLSSLRPGRVMIYGEGKNLLKCTCPVEHGLNVGEYILLADGTTNNAINPPTYPNDHP